MKKNTSFDKEFSDINIFKDIFLSLRNEFSYGYGFEMTNFWVVSIQIQTLNDVFVNNVKLNGTFHCNLQCIASL